MQRRGFPPTCAGRALGGSCRALSITEQSGVSTVPRTARSRRVALVGLGAEGPRPEPAPRRAVAATRQPRLSSALHAECRRVEYEDDMAHPTRQEVSVQLVIRRRSASGRGDNIVLAWSRGVSRLFTRRCPRPQAVTGRPHPIRRDILAVLRRASGVGSVFERVPDCQRGRGRRKGPGTQHRRPCAPSSPAEACCCLATNAAHQFLPAAMWTSVRPPKWATPLQRSAPTFA
jgi:hypothetical protein